ncbi:NYN domain-containing protein [Roseateles amylovorans]|uniref:NYN domain-containing protein n=1 Tax=Roseateles amylovorans TaxID=2978473 RepID=A0ABY6AZ48_9BURK|nr:NYN domain-containing protein [Roseateles amylovorans]UXH78237.1 NYN domain-containing protein [Roseateles amylovorans]
MKIGVYIDGYNLYYGRLRNSAYKWLDLVSLMEAILRRRDQSEQLACVHLFTAHALATFATHGAASVEAQSAYLRALQARHPDRFRITYGKHSFDKDGSLLPEFVQGQPYDRARRTRVWHLEEKKTDVNLAIAMYRDAAQGRYDRIILVSNDSDAEPALQALREDFPHIGIGVVVPIPPPIPGKTPGRRVSGSLSNLADWVIRHLTDEELQAAQLPSQVPTRKKAIPKPAHW